MDEELPGSRVPRTYREITAYRDYIAKESGYESRASRWVEHVFDSFELLRYSPQRFAVAEESKFKSFEVRRLLIGKYLAFYAVDEPNLTVRIIGFRHGARLPRPEDLPLTPPDG